MDEPTEEETPEHRGETELKDGHQETTLQQLTETGDKEAAQRGNDVTGRALT